MGGTAHSFSAYRVSPNTSHKEKHEQFTPILDVNLHLLVLLCFEIGDFYRQETRTKSK